VELTRSRPTDRERHRGSGLDLGPSIRTTLRRSVLVPSWILLGGTLFVFVVGIDVSIRLQYAVLLASAFLFGMPHGALDHLVPGRLRRGAVDRRSLAAVVGLYAVLGVGYALVWFVAPIAAFAAFILFTWFHWGQGDVHALLSLADVDHLTTSSQRATTAVVRGGVPMLVPLVAFPERYRTVATTAIGLFADESADALAPVFAPTTRLGIAIAVAVAAAVTLGLGYRRARDRRRWAIDAGETGLLAAYFASVPPVLAIGLYFTVWHSLRHVARLVLIDADGTAAIRDGRIAAALGRFARDATPATVGALALFVPLLWVVPRSPGDLPAYAALYLVLIATLTLPHVVVVTWMDREQGVWLPA
jgi:Brp/Blh family beta-carotene 15,15'-monooxygenase